jgi:hypothetical protein
MIKWLMTTRIYLWVVRDILSWIRISCCHTRLTGKKYLEGYKLLKPGYIILSTDESRISSFLTPGDLDHAALCVSKGGEYEVGEMTHLGYTKSTFFDICHTSDRVVLLECYDWDEDYIQKIIAKCKSLIGTPYDFQFNPNHTELYCSELVIACDIEARLKWYFSLGDCILPQDIYKSENVKVVWDSDK